MSNAVANDALILQFRKMVKDGISVEDACESLDLDYDAVKYYLAAEGSTKVVTAEELIAEYKPKAIRALASFALDPTEEWGPAKVSAAMFLAKGDGALPEFPIDKLSERFKKMKEIVDKADVVVNEASTYSMNNPSPATTVVDVKNPFDKSVSKLNSKELAKN